MTVTAYRITKAAFAATIWSGIGARDFGGRWNSKGVAVVYAAESRSLAAMEQLVHLVKPRVLRGYVVASVTFDDSRVQRVGPATLPPGWNAPVAPPALRRYGDDWITTAKYPALAVPSAVVPGEWNYLLNPNHPEFAGFAKTPPQPSAYHGRLA